MTKKEEECKFNCRLCDLNREDQPIINYTEKDYVYVPAINPSLHDFFLQNCSTLTYAIKNESTE